VQAEQLPGEVGLAATNSIVEAGDGTRRSRRERTDTVSRLHLDRLVLIDCWPRLAGTVAPQAG
jgi:hypothetical protein